MGMNGGIFSRSVCSDDGARGDVHPHHGNEWDVKN